MMGKKQEKDLRIVQSVVDSVIAERDAEIAALRQQVAELRRQLAAWKMEYTLEVDEFNAGHAAYNEGKRIDEEPPTTRFDEWRIGWVWGKWNAETR